VRRRARTPRPPPPRQMSSIFTPNSCWRCSVSPTKNQRFKTPPPRPRLASSHTGSRGRGRGSRWPYLEKTLRRELDARERSHTREPPTLLRHFGGLILRQLKMLNVNILTVKQPVHEVTEWGMDLIRQVEVETLISLISPKSSRLAAAPVWRSLAAAQPPTETRATKKKKSSEMHESDSCKKTHGLLLRQCKGQATVYTPGLIPQHMAQLGLHYILCVVTSFAVDSEKEKEKQTTASISGFFQNISSLQISKYTVAEC